jgi:hypothetical protein
MNQGAVPEVETRLVSLVISLLDKVQMINCRLFRTPRNGTRNTVSYLMTRKRNRNLFLLVQVEYIHLLCKETDVALVLVYFVK